MKKICINAKFIDGPFGGGIKFALDLKNVLESEGYVVVNTLNDDDIDVIINVSFFPCIYSASSFSHIDAYIYKLRKNHDVVIITRINNTPSHDIEQNELANFLQSFSLCDIIVFISEYVQQEYVEVLGHHILNKSTIIHNGGDESTFYPDPQGNTTSKLRIVTHHWSDHLQKGHMIYKALDDLLDKKEFRDKYSFRYIGNQPSFIEYKNTEELPPLNGTKLADALRECDIYITAAENEPAGMHHIEGALCGLPILYRNSGALPEFCSDYGIEFNENNLVEKLELLAENYTKYTKRLEKYRFRNSLQLAKYISLFTTQPQYDNYNIFYVYLLKFAYTVKYCFFNKVIDRMKLYGRVLSKSKT